MKKVLAFAFGALLTLAALPANAAPPALLAQHHGGGGHGGHGGAGHGGWHGGHGHGIVVYGPGWWGGGWGWGWGWGWGYPYYGYYPGYYEGVGYGYQDPRAYFETISTDVSPEEARLYLDGQLIGIADDFDGFPDYLYLAQGHYRLEFRLEGYESQTVEIDSRPGTKVSLKNHLRATGGPKGTFDGPKIEHVQRFFGKRRNVTTPIVPGGGYGDEERGRPYDNPDQPMPYNGDQDRPSGRPQSVPPPSDDWRGAERAPAPDVTVHRSTDRVRLRLRVEPPGAAVYLDDRFIGTAEEVNSLDRGVAVTPGRHTITISRPGFKERSREIDVRAGEHPSLELSLEK